MYPPLPLPGGDIRFAMEKGVSKQSWCVGSRKTVIQAFKELRVVVPNGETLISIEKVPSLEGIEGWV